MNSEIETNDMSETVDEAVADLTEDAGEDTAAEVEEGKLKGGDKRRLKKMEAEMADIRKKLTAAEAALAEEKEKYLRMLAEYDNFRRRTAKEKEAIYADASSDAVKAILPVIDNLERATAAISEEDADSTFAKGVTMTLKSATDALTKMGVTPIETDTFDPNVHNAVMHIEDTNLPEGAIVEVFQKGYKKGDTVIRYAMVTVAN